jgi:hypothetical protein
MGLQPLGAVSPLHLGYARTTLHNAVQLIASTANVLAEPKADDSHRSFSWDPGLLAFQGVHLAGDFFVRVRAVEFVAELVSVRNAVLASIELEGKPLTESLRALQEDMPVPNGQRSFDFAVFDDIVPDEDLIANPLTLAPLGAREELAQQYNHAFHTLQFVVAADATAEAIRTWPHHFDMATILHPTAEKSIGLGLSPGDADYAEPYWYITPSPELKNAEEAALPQPWRWHTKGWTGLVLPIAKLLDFTTPGQEDEVLARSMDQCLALARRG